MAGWRGGTGWDAFALAAAVLAAGALLVLATGGLSAGLALAAAASILTAAVSGALALRAERRRELKLSDELTALSGRLLRLESRAAEIAQGDGARAAAIAAEVAVDLDALSRLTSDLAETVGRHDRRLDGLVRDRAEAPPAPSQRASVPPPAVVPPAEPAIKPADPAPSVAARPPEVQKTRDLTTRDDFAAATSEILRRLSPDARRVDGPPAAGPAAQGSVADAAVTEAVEADRIDLHLQSVATLPQRRTRFYEALPRLRTPDGTTIGLDRAGPILERRGLRPRLDALTLERALAIARHLAARDSPASVSCALSRHSLSDRAFLEQAEGLLERDRLAAARILLEIDRRDLDGLGLAETTALARIVGLGPTLILGGLRDLDVDWKTAVRRGVDFAKIDAGLLLEPRVPGAISRLVAAATLAGVQLIASGIDQEELVPDLLDYDVPLAQGLAIAAPRPVRAEILAAPPPVGASAESSGPRTSFREFLRRAG